MKFLRLGIQDSEAVITGYRRPTGYQQIVNPLSATALTLPTPPPGFANNFVVIQCNGGAVRWRDDSIDPTATIGMTIPDGGELDYVGDLSKIKFIAASGTPIIDVSVYT